MKPEEEDVPTSSDGQDIDAIGRSILSSRLAEIGWKSTEIKDDFGLDGIVAVFENKKYTCLDFSYQLKSKRKLRLNKNKRIACADFTSKTVNLLRKSNGTPIIFVAETSTRKLYWEFATIAVNRWAKSPSGRKKSTSNVTLDVVPQELDATGISTLVETLRKISREILKPIQPSDGNPIQLAKLDANSDAADIRQDLQDAVDNSNAGNYSRALERGQLLLIRASGGDLTRVRKLLSKCYYELGQIDMAIEMCKQGFESGDAGIAGNLISLLAKNKNFNEAESYYGKLTPELLENPVVINALGFLKLVQGDLDSSFRFYEQVVVKDKNMFEARLNRAFILRDQGDLASAKISLRSIFEENPTIEEARVAYGNILLMEEGGSHDKALLEEAEKIYSNVIGRFSVNEPKSRSHKETRITALMGLSVVETRKANVRRAHDLMLQALQKGGAWSTVYYNLAQSEMALGLPLDARKNYVRSLRTHDDDRHRPANIVRPNLWQGFAGACLEIYDSQIEHKRLHRFLSKALWAYKIASREDVLPFTFLNYGITLIKAKRVEDAEALAEKNSHLLGSHYLRAMCFKARKNRSKMLSELKAELTLNPQDFRVNAEIGDFYFSQDDFVKAQTYYEIAASQPEWHLHSFAAELGAKLALCLNRAKGATAALTYLQELPEYLRQTPPVNYAIATVVKKQPDKLPPIWLPSKK